MSGAEMYYNYTPIVLEVPAGNCTGSSLAVAIQGLLNGFAGNFGWGFLSYPNKFNSY